MQRPIEYYEYERRKGQTFSAGMHLLFFLAVIFGLPDFLISPPPEEPSVITVEILPITGITNVKPSETPAAEKKPEEKTPEQKKPSPPVLTADNTPPPPPPDAATIDKKKEKPDEKKPDAKKDKKKAKEEDLAAVLKAVKSEAQKQSDKNKKDTKESSPTPPAKSDKYNPSLPMSMSELDFINNWYAKCWVPPAGARNAQDLAIYIDVEFNKDGSYINVNLSPESAAKAGSDGFFRAAADSAKRAVMQCSPVKGLPIEKYETWHYTRLHFDPKEMLQ